MYKVVIIDDEPWARGVIRGLGRWDSYGMEVVGEAADGETGLALIDEVRPDIVIADVRMPRMGGLDMVRRLDQRGGGALVIIVSGYDSFDYVRGALTLGVRDYLLKPVKAQDLDRVLASCAGDLEKRRQESGGADMMAGFFAEGWERQYDVLQQKLASALQAGNKPLLEQSFARMTEAVAAHESERPTVAILMAIYYSLLRPLERYIQDADRKKQAFFQGKNTVFVFSRDTALREMMDFLLDLYETAIDRMRAGQGQKSRLDVEAVCRYIEPRYASGISLEQTADAFHVTKEYLSRAFKAAKGEGFSEYVTALRMRRAYTLITEYKAPIKDVGAMVGYVDQAHFYKSFKRFFGRTPGEVRDGEMSNNDNSKSQ